jgi:hypothetical protein
VIQASIFVLALNTVNTESALWAWVICEAYKTLLLAHRSGLLSRHHW